MTDDTKKYKNRLEEDLKPSSNCCISLCTVSNSYIPAILPILLLLYFCTAYILLRFYTYTSMYLPYIMYHTDK